MSDARSTWRASSLDVVRSRIAHGWLGRCDIDDRLGTIRLLPHQRDAVARLRVLLRDGGGALLADDVGLGKTFTALASASPDDRLLVIAPAALRDMWRGALAATERAACLVSFERLSAPRPIEPMTPTFVIVDEAHHVRTPGTRRRERLITLLAHARVLLLSATPIHNRRRDLDALLALFLGDAVHDWPDDEQLRFVVRRAHDARAIEIADGAMRPRALPLEWLDVGGDDAVLDALLAIPPPIPPRDAGDGGALVSIGLARAWSSSHAALRVALRRRLARADALAHALEHGRHPDAAALRAWTIGDDGVQLAFPELFAPTTDVPTHALLDAVRAHADGVLIARRALDVARDADAARAARLAALRDHHPGERVVAFAQFEETVEAMYRRLAPRGRVAKLSARGGRVAGGPLTRAEVLRRFAPRAHGVREPPSAERIEVLLTTDLLSEGVNLTDASVVVHLDLPWTPARLEQRVGRACRIGAAHSIVHVYALRPPASVETLLRLESRLRTKARIASLVSPFSALLPKTEPSFAADAAPSPLASTEEARTSMLAWHSALGADVQPFDDGEPTLVAVASSPFDGFLALVQDGDARLVASVHDAAPSMLPSVVARACAAAFSLDARPGAVDARRATDTIHAIERFLDIRDGARLVGAHWGASVAVRRILDRIDLLVARASAHRRPRVASLADACRSVVDATRGLAHERRLARMLADDPDDVAFETRITTLVTESKDAGPDASRIAPRVLALILLVRGPANASD